MFFVAVFVYKDMTLAKVPRVLLDSANMSAMLLYIITNAVLFSFLMTYENVPHALAQWMIDQGFGWIVFLVVRGFLNRHTTEILIGVAVFLLYSGALLGDGVVLQVQAGEEPHDLIERGGELVLARRLPRPRAARRPWDD